MPAHFGFRGPMRLLLLLASVLLVGWLDLASGPDLGFALFYLPSVAAAGWWLGKRGVVTIGSMGALAWTIAEAISRPDLAFGLAAWNGLTRLAIFLVIGMLTTRVREDRDRLTILLDRERTLARTDRVTELPNSRGFLEVLMTEASRSRRTGRPLCLAYIDLDNFKRINDSYGHAAGDTVLARAATLIRENIRASDVPARIGGDEFVVLFWEADLQAAEAIARRICESLNALENGYPGTAVGASIGVAWYDAPPESVEEILQCADKAMYEAKSGGKRRVVLRRFGAAPDRLAASRNVR